MSTASKGKKKVTQKKTTKTQPQPEATQIGLVHSRRGMKDEDQPTQTQIENIQSEDSMDNDQQQQRRSSQQLPQQIQYQEQHTQQIQHMHSKVQQKPNHHHSQSPQVYSHHVPLNQQPNQQPISHSYTNPYDQQYQRQNHHKQQPHSLDNQDFRSASGDQFRRTGFKDTTQDQSLCVHHQQLIQFFCETCEEPVCQQCTIVGPHNNQLHRLNSVVNAYQQRSSKLSQIIKDNLVGKREQLMAQIHRIEYRIEEIRYVKTIIERDVKAEYEGVLDRLRQAEGKKLVLLNHEIAELQKDLDQINDVGSTYTTLTDIEAQDLTQFLLRSRQLFEVAEYLTAKPFKTTVDVYPYDLPRELTELRLQLQKSRAQEQLLGFKNEIIWKLLNQTKDPIELEKQTTQEIYEWSKLVDSFQVELERFQVVCCFCGVLLDPKVINTNCNMNGEDAQPLIQTQESPSEDYLGTERHFFSKSVE